MANFIINRREYEVLWEIARKKYNVAFAAIPCNHNMCRAAIKFESKLLGLDWNHSVAPDGRAIDEDKLTREELNMRMQLFKAALAYYMGPEAICE